MNHFCSSGCDVTYIVVGHGTDDFGRNESWDGPEHVGDPEQYASEPRGDFNVTDFKPCAKRKRCWIQRVARKKREAFIQDTEL